jgi:hypothetical protein
MSHIYLYRKCGPADPPTKIGILAATCLQEPSGTLEALFVGLRFLKWTLVEMLGPGGRAPLPLVLLLLTVITSFPQDPGPLPLPWWLEKEKQPEVLELRAGWAAHLRLAAAAFAALAAVM